MLLFAQIAKFLDQAFWIGLNQLTVANGFIWSDGSPVNFVNWNKLNKSVVQKTVPPGFVLIPIIRTNVVFQFWLT